MTQYVEAARGQESRGAGPLRPPPDRRAHELFEERARAAPSATAAVHRGARWTYARLDAAADRVAGTLLAAGLQPGSVVAVISQRSLDWLAAILGILKAGGVYLPIDPAHPDERVADLLRRGGCRLALVEDGVSAHPVEAAAVRALALAPDVAAEGRPARVHGRGLAYLHLTFGPAGVPTAAGCEHAEVVNHLLAQVDTFGLEPGTVVAQTASQSFDSSLWQALAPLVVGGSTVIIDPELMLDVPALLALLAEENVSVLQLAPRYLDVIVMRLESGHRAPGSLRLLGITGGPVSRQVLTRWFDQCPTVPVVNVRGAVEAPGDDTHEILGAAVGPAGFYSAPPRTATERRIATAWAEVLGLPLDEIGRNDNFYTHGGGSLAGVRLVVRLRGLISLVDLMSNPVLAELAAAADGARAPDSALLQALSVPERAAVALVCVPYEAGNALNFDAMARELSSSGVAVYAVELPGHDVARPADELAGLAWLTSRLSQEILDRIDIPVALWGHGAGVALALGTGRSLQAAGVAPRHLFLAAAARREPVDGEPAAADVGAWLRDTGALTDVDHLRSTRGELIERAYRHDLREAEGYLAACAGILDLPATIIMIPPAPGENDAAARCAAVLPAARITRFEDTGRYVVRSHPAAAADLVTATIAAAREGGAR